MISDLVVDVHTVADLLDVGPRRVQQFARDGMPKVARGKYDLRQCTRWYIGELIALVPPNAAVRDEAYTEARARKVAAEATLKELELKQELDRLIPIEDHLEVLGDALVILREGLLSAPARWASRLVGLKDQAAARVALEKVVEELMADLSERADLLDAKAADLETAAG